MKERPILFSAPMVQAILRGEKTQTRRVMKPQPVAIGGSACRGYIHEACPYGMAGDRLWVRETWAPVTVGYAYAADPIWNFSPSGRWHPSIHMPRAACRIELEITDVRCERLQEITEADAIAEGVNPGPGIIGDDDLVIHEIISAHSPNYSKPMMPAPVARYVLLWDSINGVAPKNWNSNPWVWVVEFKRIKP